MGLRQVLIVAMLGLFALGVGTGLYKGWSLGLTAALGLGLMFSPFIGASALAGLEYGWKAILEFWKDFFEFLIRGEKYDC